jgi:hypothetical protein
MTIKVARAIDRYFYHGKRVLGGGGNPSGDESDDAMSGSSDGDTGSTGTSASAGSDTGIGRATSIIVTIVSAVAAAAGAFFSATHFAVSCIPLGVGDGALRWAQWGLVVMVHFKEKCHLKLKRKFVVLPDSQNASVVTSLAAFVQWQYEESVWQHVMEEDCNR